MSEENYTEELEGLGYEVGEAMADVLFLKGWGVETYIPVDDTTTLDSMVDPVLHEERVQEYEEPTEPEPEP